jgi:hypothetical protein
VTTPDASPMFSVPGVVEKAARFSDCGTYRYYLSRHWGAGEALLFVMLNASTADCYDDDPTVRRCIDFARRQGYDGLGVLNLYGLRSTDPKALLTAPDPVGPDNDDYLRLSLTERVRRGLPVVAAWGVNASPDRVAQVLDLVPGVDWRCLGHTKAGAPRHPLYVRGDQPLIPLRGAA